MKRFFVFIFLIVNAIGFSQNDELHFLKGKIICQDVDLTSIIVTNRRSENVVNPQKNGDFSMFVKVGDKLTFEGMAIDVKAIEVSKDDILKKLVTVVVHAKVIPLEMVEIKTYPHINAVDLGILDKPAKKYTPAERRLRTAGDFRWYYPLLIPLGGMPLDGLMNAISGRTAMLKKELEVERNELTIKKIEDDTERFSFNTGVSTFMIAVNELSDLKCYKKEILEQLLILLTPYAPHVSEELWAALGNSGSILDASFPKFEAKYVTESTKDYPVAINGKTRT